MTDEEYFEYATSDLDRDTNPFLDDMLDEDKEREEAEA